MKSREWYNYKLVPLWAWNFFFAPVPCCCLGRSFLPPSTAAGDGYEKEISRPERDWYIINTWPTSRTCRRLRSPSPSLKHWWRGRWESLGKRVAPAMGIDPPFLLETFRRASVTLARFADSLWPKCQTNGPPWIADRGFAAPLPSWRFAPLRSPPGGAFLKAFGLYNHLPNNNSLYALLSWTSPAMVMLRVTAVRQPFEAVLRL